MEICPLELGLFGRPVSIWPVTRRSAASRPCPCSIPDPDADIPGGAALTALLHEYNDDGTILGVHIALD